MLRLNAGLSRKIGEPDYGSRGASVNLELEVEGHLVNEPDALQDRIRRLFVLARQAVDEELNGRTESPPRTEGRTNGARNGERKATTSQISAIRAICDQNNLDPDAAAQNSAGVALSALSLRQASALIDELKARSNGAGAGRSR